MKNRKKPTSPAELSHYIVQQLTSAGFDAYLAGGCVRDSLIGRTPEDFDVATNAIPEQVCHVFRRHKVLRIGEQFGIVGVCGPRECGVVEVATFRTDGTYSDGRHPDCVTYGSAQEDAHRRDFTINGLFLDPMLGRVTDYVGGQQDLKAKVIRAIGDPDERIKEDKLRMLRGVRFAAEFGFRLDPSTHDAIQRNSGLVSVVSGERIGQEMRKMLTGPNRRRAVQLLRETCLLTEILPESHLFEDASDEIPQWVETLRVLGGLSSPSLAVSLAALLRRLGSSVAEVLEVVQATSSRWRLSNAVRDMAKWLVVSEATIRSARSIAWPSLQRLLVSENIQELMQLATSVAQVVDQRLDDIDYCRDKLRLPADELDPPPLITGDDLIGLGIPTGRHYKDIIARVRESQLEGRLTAKQEALQFANQVFRAESKTKGPHLS